MARYGTVWCSSRVQGDQHYTEQLQQLLADINDIKLELLEQYLQNTRKVLDWYHDMM